MTRLVKSDRERLAIEIIKNKLEVEAVALLIDGQQLFLSIHKQVIRDNGLLPHLEAIREFRPDAITFTHQLSVVHDDGRYLRVGDVTLGGHGIWWDISKIEHLWIGYANINSSELGSELATEVIDFIARKVEFVNKIKSLKLHITSELQRFKTVLQLVEDWPEVGDVVKQYFADKGVPTSRGSIDEVNKLLGV